jgi:iron complex outermembrane receptor protein
MVTVENIFKGGSMDREALVQSLVGALLLAVSALATSPARAQSVSAADTPGLEEVIVTAERRSESAQSAPLALTVVTGDQLAAQGVSQPEDLGKLVPGLTITNSAITTISIRGVGTVTEFDSLAQLGVAVSTDGVYLDRATEVSGNFYDLNRVEAVLGPQGTLYGMNATGGAVNLISNKPTQDFGGYVQEELGDYNLRRTTGAINIPVTDTFAMRAAFYDSKRDGYLSDGYDDEDLRAGRFHALWKPNSDVSLLVTVEASRVRGQGQGNAFENFGLTGAQSSPLANSLRPNALVPAPPGFPSVQEIPQPGPSSYQRFNNWGARAQLDWNLGFGTLTYIPGYKAQTFSYVQDAVQGGLASNGDSYQLTNELRLANQTDKWNWTVGLFTLNDHVDFDFHAGFVFFTLLPAHIPALASAYQTLQTPNYNTRSDAAFGETTYSLTDKLRAILGARYTTETKTATLANQWYGEGFNIPGRSTTAIDPLTGVSNYLYPYTTDGHQKAVDTTGRVGLEYDLAPKSLLYATVSQGFKGGGFGLAPPPQTEYKPEYLTAYTLGVKNRFLNDTIQLNTELYLWDYTDQQLAVIVPDIYGALEQITVNAARSKLSGASVSFLWAPEAHDLFGAQLQYEHAIFGAYNVLSGLGPSGGGVLNGCHYTPTTFNGLHAFNESCSGLPLPFTPRWSGNANYTHAFSLRSGASVALGGDVHFATWQQTQITNLPGDVEHGYGIFDANLGYQSPKNIWSVAGYVRNIGNKLVYTNPNPTGEGFFPGIPAVDQPVSAIMPPRTFGVSLRANF